MCRDNPSVRKLLAESTPIADHKKARSEERAVATSRMEQRRLSISSRRSCSLGEGLKFLEQRVDLHKMGAIKFTDASELRRIEFGQAIEFDAV